MTETTAPQSAPAVRDREYMALALRLAANGLYDTKPNPTVGCVLVKDDGVIATGWTAPAGGPHAERVALAAAGAAARGATVYIDAGAVSPSRPHGTVHARVDRRRRRARRVRGRRPEPAREGGGARELAAAGIVVEGGLLENSAEPLNRGFFARMRRGRPWVRSKIAMSSTAAPRSPTGRASGSRGPTRARTCIVGAARSGAILTGSGTVLHDDPAAHARREEAGIDPARP